MGASAAAPSVVAALGAAEEALRNLSELDFAAMGDEDLTAAMRGVQRLRGRLAVTEARSVRAFDDAGVWALDGARSAASWISWRRHTPIGESRRLVRNAHAVAGLPAMEQAWEAGDIGATHVATMVRLDTPRTHDAFADGYKILVDAARTQHWREFKKACAYWTMHADPDGAEQRARAGREARSVHLHQSFEGQWFGDLNLDPVSGEIVAGTLAEVERELFDADWAAAKERLGRTPKPRELDRTPAQRRADALVEVFVRARSTAPGARRPRPLVSILVGYETFAGPVCETFNRTVLTPTAVSGWLRDADVERIVFDTPSRVIDVGRRTRFYRGALRHAVELRDRTCWHPTCDAQPQRPQIDHIEDYFAGGMTTAGNGRWGCEFHNHHRTWPRQLDGPPPGGGSGPDAPSPQPPGRSPPPDTR